MCIRDSCYSVLEGVRIRLEEIETELTRTQARAEKQRRVVTEASQEVKKLEKLKEKPVSYTHLDHSGNLSVPRQGHTQGHGGDSLHHQQRLGVFR